MIGAADAKYGATAWAPEYIVRPVSIIDLTPAANCAPCFRF